VPKIAKGQTISREGTMPAPIPAGKYKIVVQKGTETYTQDWDISYDPRSTLNLEDRKLKELTVQKVFDLTESLAYLVYELDETINSAKQLMAKNSSLSSTISPITAEYNKLKETLVVTTGDNYVSGGEPQLREHLASLFRKLASSMYKPSANEFANLKRIELEFNAAKSELLKLKGKHVATLNGLLTQNQMAAISVKPFEEFLKLP
jgi:hypothetical protein